MVRLDVGFFFVSFVVVSFLVEDDFFRTILTKMTFPSSVTRRTTLVSGGVLPLRRSVSLLVLVLVLVVDTNLVVRLGVVVVVLLS